MENLIETKQIDNLDNRIHELRELFEKYESMYQIPGVSMEIIRDNFERYYLSSVKNFDPKKIVQPQYSGYDYRERFKWEIDELVGALERVRKGDLSVEEFLNHLYDLDNVFVARSFFDELSSLASGDLPKYEPLRKKIVQSSLDSDNELIKAEALRISYGNNKDSELREIISKSKTPYLKAMAVKKLRWNFGEGFDFDYYNRSILQNENEHPIVKLVFLKEIQEYFQRYGGASWLAHWKRAISIKEKYIEREIIRLSEFCDERLYSDHFDFGQLKMEKWKGGGRIETLGGKFLGKMITRYTPLKGFSMWRKAYENPQIWKEGGFDYVPIELIISFRNDKEVPNLVRVQTGVLGISLREYGKLYRYEYPFYYEIDRRIKKIKEILRKNRISYDPWGRRQHWHDGNFCLRWERDRDTNEINWEKQPRVYLIDFDHAEEGYY